MKKIAIVSILTLFCAFTCVFGAGAVSAQEGWEKTLTLPSGEVVLDMSGEWDVYHEFLERYKWKGKPSSSITLITQEGNTFSGVNPTGTKFLPKGTQTFKGILDKDGFKEVQAYTIENFQKKWVPVTWEISEHGNKIVFVDRDR
jgi:hypothetical protein